MRPQRPNTAARRRARCAERQGASPRPPPLLLALRLLRRRRVGGRRSRRWFGRRLVHGLVVDRGELETRLNLIGVDALPLPPQLLDREILQVVRLLVRERLEARLQLVHARARCRDAVGEHAGVGRNGGTCLPNLNVTLLRLDERALELLDRAPLVPEPRLV